MSLAKFLMCSRLISARRDARALVSLSTKFSKPIGYREASAKVSAVNYVPPSCGYTTSAKPHMTQALHKWKKRKKKSKAQQRREMEKLQEDLVKLLSKRAIQLVKNNSLMDAHREVVTTHAFTSLARTDENDKNFFGKSFTETDAPHFTDRRKRSDYIAHAVETQIQEGVKSYTIKDQEHVKAEKDHASMLKIPTVIDKHKHHQPVSVTTHDHTALDSASDTSSHSRGIGSSSNVKSLNSHDIVHKKVYLKPFTFTDLFSEPVKHSKKIDKEDGTGHFLSAMEKFKSDFETSNKLYAKSSLHPLHNWSAEVSDTSHGASQSSAELTGSLELPQSHLAQDPIPTSLSEHKHEHAGLSLRSQNQSTGDEHQLRTEISPVMPLGENVTASGQQGFKKAVDDGADLLHDSAAVKVSIKPKTAGKEKKLAMKDLKKFPKFVKDIKDKKTRTVSQKRDVAEDIRPEWDHSEHSKVKGQPPIDMRKELQDLTDKCFTEASCFTACEMLAVRNLQFQMSKHRITSIDVFNRLIHTLAKNGNLETIKTLFSLIRQQELSATLQTYAGCLECCGRMPQPDVDVCDKLIADLAKSGLDLAEIANACSFESDEWDYVLKAIRLVRPDFVPRPARLKTEYDNPLLSDLNGPRSQAVESNQYSLDMSVEELMQRASAQLQMEKEGQVVVESIWNSHGQGDAEVKLRESGNRVMRQWRRMLLQSFKQKLVVYEKKAQDNVHMTLYPYLKLFPPQEYIDIIFKVLKEILLTSEGYSPTQAMVHIALGQAVNRKFNTMAKIAAGMDQKVMKLYGDYMSAYLDPNYPLDKHRFMWLRAMNKHFDTINMDLSAKKWPNHIYKEIGKLMLEMVLYDLKIDANLFRTKAPERLVPAFSSIFRPDLSMHTNAEIQLHPVVSKLFKADNIDSFTFEPSVVPMIVPPVPWISKKIGSLLLGSTVLVRTESDKPHMDALRSSKESRYPAVLDSLNTVSACAWKINKPILDLQIEIFNNKGNASLKVAPPAADLPPLPNITARMGGREKALLYKERLVLQQQRQDMHGLWCTDLYRLSIAKKFRDEVFWFPHSMDFRGRTYPVPPHFNHLGSDNVRGMLFFAKGKALGEDGYDWLKIHLVNLTGYKKRESNTERLAYANSIMEDILDSADNPLTGRKWWQSSDEPWQTLACCMEIANIERFEGDKRDYVCHFPVHQDGSCNGLQHYAALGRDQAGAESVNLHPFDAPQDVYSDVVELVEKVRQKDAAEGNEIAQALEGFIRRKVIKQTIMTTVYGVTKYGAKLQIQRQLKDIPEFPTEQAWKAGLYLTDTTFACLREMFTATKDIQDWLTQAAAKISTFAPVDWVTPLGFPVLQLYYKPVSRSQSQGRSKHDDFKPNIMKQRNAFPPNYIHSLDSTHMMLTSLYCMHAGITFVSVHDCYWTHAADVPIMNKICREQFVNMHKQPLLEDLSQHLTGIVNRAMKDPNLKEDMKKVDVPSLLALLNQVPQRGSFELDNVLKSTYFFS